MSSIAEKGNPIKEFVLPAGILTLICTIAAAALVCTYQVTNPIIEENTRKAADAAARRFTQGYPALRIFPPTGWKTSLRFTRPPAGRVMSLPLPPRASAVPSR